MVTPKDLKKIKQVQAIIKKDKRTISILQKNIKFMEQTIKDFKKTR